MYLHTKYTEAPLDYLLNSLKKELYLDLFIFPYVIIPITVKHSLRWIDLNTFYIL
jgi:hypothetical protein